MLHGPFSPTFLSVKTPLVFVGPAYIQSYSTYPTFCCVNYNDQSLEICQANPLMVEVTSVVGHCCRLGKYVCRHMCTTVCSYWFTILIVMEWDHRDPGDEVRLHVCYFALFYVWLSLRGWWKCLSTAPSTEPPPKWWKQLSGSTTHNTRRNIRRSPGWASKVTARSCSSNHCGVCAACKKYKDKIHE